MQEMNCLVIEDEPLAARVLEDYISQTPGLYIAASCENAMEASEKIYTEKPDLIFLDINLPKINGLSFIKNLHPPCPVILTTAYHEYALEGFELGVVDYLLKPITFERFLKAVNKARSLYFPVQKPALTQTDSQDYFFVKAENKLEKINFKDILFIESLANYIVIQTQHKKVTTYSTLKNIEAFLSAQHFIKVQKSFIVALDKIEFIEGNHIGIGGRLIPISRNNKEEVMETIVANKILKR